MAAPAAWWRSTADRTEARTLGWALAGSGAVSLVTAVVPFSDTAPTGKAAIAGAVGLALGAWLLGSRSRVSNRAVHLLLLFATAVITALLLAATTDVGRAVTSYSYLWPAMFTAWFHHRRLALGHLAAIGAGFAAVLISSGAPAPAQTWGFVMTSVIGVAAVLNHLVRQLRSLAERDQLTGLLTRAAFADTAQRYITLAQRTGQPLALALIDLDDFKSVNDRQGHAAGDALLAGTAGAWSRAVRRGDVLGRHGGDEFVLLMPATTDDEAAAVLQRLVPVSTIGWSAGVAAWDGDDLSRWLQRADQALYADKGAGGGRGPRGRRPDR